MKFKDFVIDQALFRDPYRRKMAEHLETLKEQTLEERDHWFVNQLTDEEILLNHGLYKATLDVVNFLIYSLTDSKEKNRICEVKDDDKPLTEKQFTGVVQRLIMRFSRVVPTGAKVKDTENHMLLILLLNIGVD